MRAALNNNRMSLMTLANKHFLGIDGFSLDYDSSYCNLY